MVVPTVWLENARGGRWEVALTCSLGRATSNNVVIDDGKVSRRHALVHRQDETEFWVIDLGSGNGTYLNGRRVTQPTRLNNADILTLGDHTLTFRQSVVPTGMSAPSRANEQTIINVKSVDCWMLVADIKGSSAMAARLPPTEMAMQVGRWMAVCKEIIDANAGTINKFLGDGFFAFWQAGPEGDAGIVETLKKLQQMQSDADGLRFRMVTHFGSVAFGGGGSLGEDSLSGIDVVVAFRMEKIAGSLGCDVMASEIVRNLLDGRLPFRDLGTHAVPGLDPPPHRFFAVEG